MMLFRIMYGGIFECESPAPVDNVASKGETVVPAADTAPTFVEPNAVLFILAE